MTVNEFKAWLEGFEESFTGRPTAAQWKKVKERLDSVEGGDYNFWYQGPPSRPWWPTWWTYTVSSNNDNPVSGSITIGNNSNPVYGEAAETVYCSSAAEIGREEGARLAV